MPWSAAALTTLAPGHRVTVVVLPDDLAPMVGDMCLAGRVVAVELCEYVALPEAQVIEGSGDVASTVLMGWEDFQWALDTDSGVLVTHVPLGDGERCERLTIVADDA